MGEGTLFCWHSWLLLVRLLLRRGGAEVICGPCCGGQCTTRAVVDAAEGSWARRKAACLCCAGGDAGAEAWSGAGRPHGCAPAAAALVQVMVGRGCRLENEKDGWRRRWQNSGRTDQFAWRQPGTLHVPWACLPRQTHAGNNPISTITPAGRVPEHSGSLLLANRLPTRSGPILILGHCVREGGGWC